MTLSGRPAKSFRIQRRWVVVRSGPKMVEREVFSDLASVIPQPGRMTAVCRKKQQTDRLDGPSSHNNHVCCVFSFLRGVSGSVDQSLNSPGLVYRNSSHGGVFVYLTETCPESAQEMIIRGIANPDRTDMTNPKVLTARSLFVVSPCSRLWRRVENDTVLVGVFRP